MNKTFHLTGLGINNLLESQGFRRVTNQTLRHFREGQKRIVQLKSGEKVYEYPPILKKDIDFNIKKAKRKPFILYSESALQKIKDHLKKSKK